MSQFVEQGIQVPVEERSSRFPVYVLAAAIVILAGGAGHGIVNGRWSDRAPDSEAWETVLDRIPSQIGEWVATELPDIDHPRGLRSLHREYQNQVTNRAVSLLLLVGPPGLLDRQPINRMFAGHPYRAVTDPSPVNIRTRDLNSAVRTAHAFLESDFYEPGVLDTEQLIATWAWTENGVWESPAKPLDRFANSPHVWRLYVLQEWDYSAEDRPDDVRDFLQIAIPQLSSAIQPDEATDPGSNQSEQAPTKGAKR